MTSKHTPGPWKYGFESISPDWAIITAHDGGAIIANVNADARQDANARLIAAAPELLGALRAVATVGIHEINDWRAVALRMQETALVAIAKATGGAP